MSQSDSSGGRALTSQFRFIVSPTLCAGSLIKKLATATREREVISEQSRVSF
jgi:hypothetical protein